MFCTGAVVSGSGVALKGVAEVTTVQVVVPQVIMASPEEGGRKGRRVSGRRGGCKDTIGNEPPFQVSPMGRYSISQKKMNESSW